MLIAMRAAAYRCSPDRHGIARTLLLRCLRKATAAGISIMECHSTLVAVDFYRAAGFNVVEQKEMKLTPVISINGVLLRRNLP